MVVYNYLLVAKRILLLALLYSLIRFYFYTSNLSYFGETSLYAITESFILGLRFDLIAITAINLLYIVLAILPLKFQENPNYQKSLKWFFIFSNLPFLFLNLSDTEYFKFTGKRTTFDVVNMSGDIMNQSLQLAANYWHIPILTISAGLLLYFLYPEAGNRTKPVTAKIPLAPAFVILLLTIGSGILVIRGSLERRPITLKQAFAITPVKLGHLVLNTPFSFLYTIQAKGVEKKQYFTDEKEYLNIIKVAETKNEGPLKKKNVMIIILESFSREYIGYKSKHPGHTPFLDSLSEHALFFTNAYANGRKSIEALPAILAGIPALMDEPFINSIYQNNNIEGLGTTLKSYGYHTSFFHGGINGTMGFDAFSAQAGFDEYYGLNEYPDNEKDFDGKWGIFDEPFLQFYAEKLDEFSKPFCSSVFTLTSHPPYPIPEKYKGEFPQGPLPIHETIGYTDHALKRFFQTIKDKEWYENTLFIITADHTQEHFNAYFQNEAGDYMVPMIFFAPGDTLEANTEKVVQHVDIVPSVLDYLNINPKSRSLIGQSVFNQRPGFALNQTNGIYRIFSNNTILQYTDNGLMAFKPNPFSGSKSHKISKEEVEQHQTLLKAYVQYFNNGLIDNRLFIAK